MSRSEIAWVAQLSCGHVIGSVPPHMRDVDAPIDSVQASRMVAAGIAPPARSAQPAEPAFVEPPEREAVMLCDEHPCSGEGRWVVDIVFNTDQPRPRLAEARAGTL